jgi:hypothetical protein
MSKVSSIPKRMLPGLICRVYGKPPAGIVANQALIFIPIGQLTPVPPIPQ